MARIAGVDLPREKRVEIGLTYIYGIDVHHPEIECRQHIHRREAAADMACLGDLDHLDQPFAVFLGLQHQFFYLHVRLSFWF